MQPKGVVASHKSRINQVDGRQSTSPGIRQTSSPYGDTGERHKRYIQRATKHMNAISRNKSEQQTCQF